MASLNYRLSPHPHHPTDPSQTGDPARSSKWPDYIRDVEAGIKWVLDHGDDDPEGKREKPRTDHTEGRDPKRKRQYILAGHSVGGTMTMLISQSGPLQSKVPRPLAIIPLCGIYDFTTLRDAHLENKDLYNAFTTAAFGPEDDGGWERGDCTKGVIDEEVKVIVMGHGKEDKLVDWGQAEQMARILEKVDGSRVKGGGGRKAEVLTVEGNHNEVWEKGEGVARCVGVTVRLLEGMGYV